MFNIKAKSSIGKILHKCNRILDKIVLVAPFQYYSVMLKPCIANQKTIKVDDTNYV